MSVALRLETVREAMRAHALDALYVRTLSNIAWLTGFEHVFDSEQAHVLVVTEDACALHSDSRYAEALRAAQEGTPIGVDCDRKSHGTFLVEQLGALDVEHARVGIEDSISLAEFRGLERLAADQGFSLVETAGLVEAKREVKDAAEIERMRRAQKITDAAFARITEFMRVGMTEREVQLALDRFMFDEGAEGLAFDTIVATGAHAASPHAQPGETRLAAGDAVVMDFGARWAGYCSDMTRTVFMGEPSDEVRRAWETLRRANEECEAYVAAGVTGAAAHLLAEQVLADGGFGGRMGHSLGHSVGLDIHEGPNLSPSNTRELVAGNVVTVEPGIYVPGKFGMRLEDFGVVTDEGYDVFTQSTHDMVIIRGC